MDNPSPLEAIFFAALEKASPAERATYLDEACVGDSDLRGQVERMVAAQAKAGSFLEQPAAALAATTAYEPLQEDPGTVIGPYKLLEQIGEGGFGVVYMAEQQQPIRRRVALKIIKPGMDTKEVIARFEAERQALALMDHPHIARVLDAGTTETGRPYFVMDLVKGIPITNYCDQQQLNPRQRLELFVTVCRAVQHAHQKGIIHRDLKPTNVLVELHDVTSVPKVIDFGVAKAINQQLTERTLFTNFGQMIGTPLYMSPEQAQLTGLDVDTRSDVYSLGVLLYELLTGTTPFDRETLREAGYDEIRRIIQEDEPPKPSVRISTLQAVALSTVSESRSSDPRKLGQTVRGELDWIVMKALEKDRTRRYESASSFAADIERYLKDEPVEACPPSVAYRLRKFVLRNQVRLGVFTLLGVAMLTVLAVFLKFEIESQQREQNTTRSVTERLAAARVYLQAHDYQAAREQLDKAQGRLNQTQWHEGSLATTVATLSEEVSDKFHAEKRFNDFQQLRERVHSEVYKAFGVSQLRAQEDCDAALSLYRVLEAGLWTEQSAFQELDSKQQTVLEEGVVELLYILARSEAKNPLLPEHPKYGDPRAIARGHRRAIDALRRIETFHRPIPAAYLWMARSWRALGKENLARKAEERYKLLASTTFLDYFLLGEHYAVERGGDNLEQALQNYSQALSLKPDHFLSLLASGAVLGSLGRYEVGEAMLTGAIAVYPRAPFAYTERGICRIGQNKLDLAQADFFKVMELNPQQYKGYELQSIVFSRKGNLAQALAMISRALELNPYSFNSRLSRGWLFALLGDDEQAIDNFTQLIEYLEPHYGTTQLQSVRDYLIIGYFNRALAQARLGRIEDARKDVTNALKVEPDNADVQNRTAWFLATCPVPDLRDAAQAVERAKKAVQQEPQQEVYCRTLGVAYYRAGKLVAAVMELERSMELGNQRASNKFFLAMANWQLDHKDEARQWYGHAVEWMEKNSPNNRELVRFRAEAAELLGIPTEAKKPILNQEEL